MWGTTNSKPSGPIIMSSSSSQIIFITFLGPNSRGLWGVTKQTAQVMCARRTSFELFSSLSTYLKETRGVSYYGLAIYILKSILRQKKNCGNSNISPCQTYNLQKHPLKETKILQRYHNSITNFKFQHKPKYHLSKNPHIKKIDLLHRGQNPLSYYTLL